MQKTVNGKDMRIGYVIFKSSFDTEKSGACQKLLIIIIINYLDKTLSNALV